jgi:hypothetical protein
VREIGFHIWDITERSTDDQVYSLKLAMAMQLLYTPILCLVKASIIVFLLRLGDQRRVIRYPLKALFAFNLGQMIAVLISTLTQCHPIHMFWDHPRTDRAVDGGILNSDYKCFDAEAFAMTNGGIAILTDILILIIPIVMVWPLRLNWRKKLAIGSVLSLGWIVVAVALVRLKSFHDLYNVVNPDPTYALGVTTSSVEVNVAVTLCCGPAVNSMINRFAPRIFATRNKSRETADIVDDPYDYEIPARLPKRYDMPSLFSSRNSTRPHRVMDEEEHGPVEQMDYASLEARRAEIIRAMINNDKNGRGVYMR